MKSIVVLLSLTALLWSGCSGGSDPKPDTLVEAGYDQAEMDAAIARARRETDDFLAVLAKGEADSFSVKAPISDSHGTEHIWIADIRYENGEFVGLIGNDPGIVKNVRFGQEWRIRKVEISDWMYVRGDRIYGGYTIDPLLGSWDPAEAEALRKQLVR